LQVNQLLTVANTTASQIIAQANSEGNAAIVKAEVLFYHFFYQSIVYFRLKLIKYLGIHQD
jgi:hypothetical protein